MSSEYKVPAFKEVLKEHADHEDSTSENKILQVGENKQLVIRRVVFWEKDEKEIFGTLPLEERAKMLTQVFSELPSKYGIGVAPFRFVVALDEKKEETLFAVVDNVAPSGIGPVEKDEKRLELLKKLVSYYEQKAASGEPFLWDIVGSDQYIYGRSIDDTTDKFYLVDLDPHIRESEAALVRELGELEGTIREEINDLSSYGAEAQPYENLIDRVDTVRRTLDPGEEDVD